MLARMFSVPKHVLILLVKAYRLIVSPWLGNVCRFSPSCSAYSLQALQDHGALIGTGLTLYRIVRCNPLCRGGHDPVPAVSPGLFTRFTDPTSRCVAKLPSLSRFTFRKKTRT